MNMEFVCICVYIQVFAIFFLVCFIIVSVLLKSFDSIFVLTFAAGTLQIFR